MSRVAEFRWLLLRDVDRVMAEVRAYPDDESLWRMAGRIPNSGGTLALHLAGNLQHFVGAILGGSGYRRDREREFAARDLDRAALLGELAAAREAIDTALGAMTDADLDAEWTGGGPLPDGSPNALMLLHLSGHLGYHLGQLDYHRRLLAAEG
ncbi:DinB family protein [Gaopeijia maritima]|uniref:DinB family protein n=1 Tax=Gaopeijia maritima TaxID=3119007 RepID=UPI0032847612